MAHSGRPSILVRSTIPAAAVHWLQQRKSTRRELFGGSLTLPTEPSPMMSSLAKFPEFIISVLSQAAQFVPKIMGSFLRTVSTHE